MIKPSDKQKAFMDFKPNENTIKLASIRTPNESNPNEALESLKLLGGFSWHNKPFKKSFPDLFNNVEHALLKAQELESKLQRWYDLLSMDGINSKQVVKEEIYNLLNILNNNSK